MRSRLFLSLAAVVGLATVGLATSPSVASAQGVHHCDDCFLRDFDIGRLDRLNRVDRLDRLARVERITRAVERAADRTAERSVRIAERASDRARARVANRFDRMDFSAFGPMNRDLVRINTANYATRVHEQLERARERREWRDQRDREHRDREYRDREYRWRW